MRTLKTTLVSSAAVFLLLLSTAGSAVAAPSDVEEAKQSADEIIYTSYNTDEDQLTVALSQLQEAETVADVEAIITEVQAADAEAVQIYRDFAQEVLASEDADGVMVASLDAQAEIADAQSVDEIINIMENALPPGSLITAEKDNAITARASKITCTPYAHQPHGSNKEKGMIHGKGDVSCTRAVTKIASTYKIYRYYSANNTPVQATKSQESRGVQNSHLLVKMYCVPGTYYGAINTTITWPAGYIGVIDRASASSVNRNITKTNCVNGTYD